MDWLGIGVTIIGIALFVLVILLIKPLLKLAGVLRNLQNTTSKLPEQVEELTDQAKDTLHMGNKTLHEVNKQVKELTPIFHMVGDATRAANSISASMTNAIMQVRNSKSEGNAFTSKNHLEGIYGLVTLAYFIMQYNKKHNTIDMN
ncbi:MAG: DUF948 domain-containing protein [Virgibacillus proomii]|jgi:uncharacterized protein YoxC